MLMLDICTKTQRLIRAKQSEDGQWTAKCRRVVGNHRVAFTWAPGALLIPAAFLDPPSGVIVSGGAASNGSVGGKVAEADEDDD